MLPVLSLSHMLRHGSAAHDETQATCLGGCFILYLIPVSYIILSAH